MRRRTFVETAVPDANHVDRIGDAQSAYAGVVTVSCQTGCDRPVVGEMLYYGLDVALGGDDVSSLPLCDKHLATARSAADLLGGEPVWEMSKWMDLTGRGARLRQAATRRRPRVFGKDEMPPLASGAGYVAPLLNGQFQGRVVVIATERRIAGVVLGRIRIEWRWQSVQGWTIREVAFPLDDCKPSSAIDIDFSPSGGSYTLLIKAHDLDSWDKTTRRMVQKLGSD